MADESNLPATADEIDAALTFGSGETRRVFLKQVAGTGAVVALGAQMMNSNTLAAEATPDVASEGAVDVALRINGRETKLRLDPRVTLLDALRERLALTGTKKGCDHGQCGACTVLIDGRRINSCLTLAVVCDGAEITTIEGLAKGDELHPMQAAFIEHDGFQCGYCTPGQICSAVALLQEGHAKSDGEIREWMSGNLCRCGAYPNILAAIKKVRDAEVKA